MAADKAAGRARAQARLAVVDWDAAAAREVFDALRGFFVVPAHFVAALGAPSREVVGFCGGRFVVEEGEAARARVGLTG